MIAYEIVSKQLSVLTSIENNLSKGWLDTLIPNNLVSTLSAISIPNTQLVNSFANLKVPELNIPLVMSEDILKDFSLFSINTKLIEKVFENAKWLGFNDSEIKEIVEKEQDLIFDTSEDFLDLTQKSTMPISIDYIQNCIESKIAIDIISRLKSKRINSSKSLKKNVEQLANIASFVYYRSFLDATPSIVS